MSENMSYCRFENTLRALRECYDAAIQAGGLEALAQQKDDEGSAIEAVSIREMTKLIERFVDL